MQKYEVTYNPECRAVVLAIIEKMLEGITAPVKLSIEASELTPIVTCPQRVIRSPRSAPCQKTLLSVFLRDYRMKEEITQAEFLTRLGIRERPQYISKLETGRIGHPDEKFLRALSKLSGKSLEELNQMAGTDTPTSE